MVQLNKFICYRLPTPDLNTYHVMVQQSILEGQTEYVSNLNTYHVMVQLL